MRVIECNEVDNAFFTFVVTSVGKFYGSFQNFFLLNSDSLRAQMPCGLFLNDRPGF